MNKFNFNIIKHKHCYIYYTDEYEKRKWHVVEQFPSGVKKNFIGRYETYKEAVAVVEALKTFAELHKCF